MPCILVLILIFGSGLKDGKYSSEENKEMVKRTNLILDEPILSGTNGYSVHSFTHFAIKSSTVVTREVNLSKYTNERFTLTSKARVDINGIPKPECQLLYKKGVCL